MPNSIRQKAVYNIFLNFSIQIFLTKSARYFILSPTSFIKPLICAICISLHIVYFSQKNTPSFNGVPLFRNLLYHKPQCISKIKDFLDVRALHYHQTKIICHLCKHIPYYFCLMALLCLRSCLFTHLIDIVLSL